MLSGPEKIEFRYPGCGLLLFYCVESFSAKTHLTRLIFLTELCGTFFHLKRPAQAALSVVLRRAIWSWIDSFGSEFSALAATGRRLEGGPEMLFDIIFSLSESSKRKTFAWPVMAMLLVCCPDILGKLVLGEGGKASLSKKVRSNANLTTVLACRA